MSRNGIHRKLPTAVTIADKNNTKSLLIFLDKNITDTQDFCENIYWIDETKVENLYFIAFFDHTRLLDHMCGNFSAQSRDLLH